MTALSQLVATHAPALPILVFGARDRAALRFLEFFTVNIRNRNTPAAYGRAAGDFLNWCEGQGLASWDQCMWPRTSNCCVEKYAIKNYALPRSLFASEPPD
jgi:hypothetical protein